jgi:hypothetical protein
VDANPNDNLRTLQEVLPGDDFDRDGLTNYEEFLAGTSPLSAASVFAAVAPAVAAGSPVTIRWYSIPGKTYTVYKATDLRVGFSILQDNLTASSTLSSFTDANPTNRAFYLIRVR